MVLLVAPVFPGVLGAQESIPPDRDALLEAEGMGLAQYAERNGYPGPKHVLVLRDTLGLTPDQARKTEALIEGVGASAAIVGRQIVESEERLHAIFSSGAPIDQHALDLAVKELGALRARLRFIHLQAHVEMAEVLTDGQRQLYMILRGHALTPSR